jgi:acetyl-CoA carboxylase / biotin carboxylase 1
MIGSWLPRRMFDERKFLNIFRSGNSGTRFYIASDVRVLPLVSWVDPSYPSEISTTYLYRKVKPRASSVQYLQKGYLRMERSNFEHNWYRSWIAAETLIGSGLIAGESSAAYEEALTRTLVTVRSVGIGACSVRLEQRIIQKENAATSILTRFSALNKYLDHDV